MFYFIYYTLFLSYEEILYRYLTGLGYNLSLLPCIIYIIFISCILSLIHKLMPRLLSNILLHIVSLILCIYYCASFIVKNVFNITISLSTLSLYKNITSGVFMDTTVSVIQENILYILIVCLPFILSFIFTRFNKTEFSLKQISFNILTVLVSYLLFLISLNLNTEYNSIYFRLNGIDKTVNSFGAIPGFVIDARKNLTGFETGAVISKPQEETEKEEEINHDPQILDIDFDSLNKNNTVINMSEYFKNEEYSYKNEYTGLFEDKNLIYIMAESFDGYFVNPELTPTLYKMIHSGLYFDNYYSPTNLSTIGGEFSLLTGLLPDLQCLNWQWIQDNDGYINTFSYGLGNLFKERNYSVYAYHDYDYSFQSRDKYLSSLGFDNYSACFNGLEEKISCSIFPASDDEMINATIDDYINDEHFMVYYATVSGHGRWEFTDNDMSIKNRALVEDLDYSETVKAYIAANLELEKAMTSLLNRLEEAGKLDDTVIVLAADHHPYFMSDEDMENLAKKELDQFSLYKNNLIIYNAEMEYTQINKSCSTIDVLPTVLNLFGIKYDSRIIIGKDILDDSGTGLVIFADHSWLDEYGSYSAANGTYSGSRDNDYVNYICSLVENRYLMSRNILIQDYYKLIFN